MNKYERQFLDWIDKKTAECKDDTKAGKAEGEKGMAAAAQSASALLQAAQSVANKLSANGPVTIDDVIHEMRRIGYKDSDIEAGGKKAKNWKGSVFSGSEWVCVGQIASREKSAHGRMVRQWATKAWLRNNPVNGSQSDASAFHLYKIYQEAAHLYPAGEELVIMLGKDMLDSSLASLTVPKVGYLPDGRVEYKGKTMYGCTVIPFEGVGSICVPRRVLEISLRKASIYNKEVPV